MIPIFHTPQQIFIYSLTLYFHSKFLVQRIFFLYISRTSNTSVHKKQKMKERNLSIQLSLPCVLKKERKKWIQFDYNWRVSSEVRGHRILPVLYGTETISIPKFKHKILLQKCSFFFLCHFFFFAKHASACLEIQHDAMTQFNLFLNQKKEKWPWPI